MKNQQKRLHVIFLGRKFEHTIMIRFCYLYERPSL